MIDREADERLERYRRLVKQAEASAAAAERAAGKHASVVDAVRVAYGTADPKELDRMAGEMSEEADALDAELERLEELFSRDYGDKL